MSHEAGLPRANAYAREIERRWSRLLERPVVLSPKDWALISDWHARGIPLALVLDSMRLVSEHPRGRLPRGLSYIAPAVEEAWLVVVDGRRERSAPAPRSGSRSPIAAWRLRSESESPESALGRLLSELLSAHDAGESEAVLDGRLNDRLVESVPADLLQTTRERVDNELAPFAERMDTATMERTRIAAVVERLRRELGLPTLDRVPRPAPATGPPGSALLK